MMARSLPPLRTLLVAIGVAAVAGTAFWYGLDRPRIDRSRVYRIGYGNDAPLHNRTER